MNKNGIEEHLLDFVETLLNDNNRLSFRMKGYSMFPTLREGDVGVVSKCSPREVKVGDIVVFRSGNKLIAHRLIKITDKEGQQIFIAKGDKNSFNDEPFSASQLEGKLETITRSKKTFKVDNFGMKFRRSMALNFKSFSSKMNQFLVTADSLIRNSGLKLLSLKENFKLISENSKGIIFTNALITILQGILPFVIIVFIKLLVDQLSTLSTKAGTTQFAVLLALTAFVFLLNGILTEIRNLFSEKLSQSVARNIYAQLHKKHTEIDISHYENATQQNAMHRAVQEASYRPVKIINDFLLLIRSLAAGLFLVSIFLTIKWYLVLVLILATIPGVIHKVRYARLTYKLKISQSTSEREMYYYNRVLTAFPFAKELRLFSFSSFFLNRFRKVQQKIFDERLLLRKKELRFGVLSQVFAVALIFLSLAYVSYLKYSGNISTGTVVLFFFSFQRGYSVLSDLFSSLTQIVEDNTFLNDFVSFLNIKNKTQNIENKPFTLKKGISIENLHFSYETSTREALKGINIEIPAGKTVAFAGANGSGKTTMIKLLCGFYEPDRGKILFDNTEASAIGMQNICKNTSAVFQDFALYNVTALLNIALGNIRNAPVRENVTTAARSAGIHEVLDNLPKGYENMLGVLFEGGEELSIGQWQKLALARAFYRDAPLILMDEPSSALDAISEMQIIDSLKKLAENKTAVIISHRLTTVKWVDLIYFFDKGEVVEQGTHEELMALKGKYYQMFQTSGSKYFIE